MEQNESSTPVSQPSMMELRGNKKDHHLSSWTKNNTHTHTISSWETSTTNTTDSLIKKRKTTDNITENKDINHTETPKNLPSLEEINVENDMNPDIPSLESDLDISDLFEEEIHYFRRVFTDSDVYLQQTIEDFQPSSVVNAI